MSRSRYQAVAAAAALLLISAVPIAAQSEEPATEGAVVDVVGVEYAYEGLPTGVPAGTSLSFANGGIELHELAVARIADDTTESLEELMALGDAAVETGKVELVGVIFAEPGVAGEGVLTVEGEGRYIAICFIPQGMDPAVMADLGVTLDIDPEDWPAEAQAIQENPPHAALGMVQEFVVTAADTEIGPMPGAAPAA